MFGWVIARKNNEPGEQIIMKFPIDIYESEVNSFQLPTKGRATLTYTGMPEGLKVRDSIYPGLCPRLEPDANEYFHPAGSATISTTTEFFEYWCCFPEANGGKMPQLEKFTLLAGQTLEIGDRKLFLCEGTLQVSGVEHTSPLELEFQTTRTVTAVTDSYGWFVLSLP